MRFEADGLKELKAVFSDASDGIMPGTRKVVARAAYNIKNDARRKASGLRHAPHYPRSITYSTAETATSASAEIGPDKNKTQGALGNILEYGTSNNPPYAHLGPALDHEGPPLARYLGDLAEDLLQ